MSSKLIPKNVSDFFDIKSFKDKVNKKLEELMNDANEWRRRKIEEVEKRINRKVIRPISPTPLMKGAKSEKYGGKFNK